MKVGTMNRLLALGLATALMGCTYGEPLSDGELADNTIESTVVTDATTASMVGSVAVTANTQNTAVSPTSVGESTTTVTAPVAIRSAEDTLSAITSSSAQPNITPTTATTTQVQVTSLPPVTNIEAPTTTQQQPETTTPTSCTIYLEPPVRDQLDVAEVISGEVDLLHGKFSLRLTANDDLYDLRKSPPFTSLKEEFKHTTYYPDRWSNFVQAIKLYPGAAVEASTDNATPDSEAPTMAGIIIRVTFEGCLANR